jgi:ubiquinone/menaquinone biosynthesis C-methylase UbiE
MEYHYTKKTLSEYITQDMSVAEIGCATGYYASFFAEKCASYLGIDLSPENVALFNRKMADQDINNAKAEVGDATDLRGVADGSFDAVLTLGPLYHLPEDERPLAIRESRRICKDGGFLAFAYINLAGAYAHACLTQRENIIYPNKKANVPVIRERHDDIHSNLFFYSMPEDIEQLARSAGLSVLKNVGVSFVFDDNFVNGLPEEQYEAWLELTDVMARSPSCTGLSEFALLLCRK